MARRLLIGLWLTGCGGGPGPEPAEGCDPSLSWDAVGAPFVTTWCTPCHAEGLQGPARSGAPGGLDLETLEQVRAAADRIRALALSDDATMPPAGPAPADERGRMAAWLDCGAPGTSVPIEPPGCDGPVWSGPLVASEGPGPCPGHARLGGDLVVDEALDPSWGCVCAIDGTLSARAPQVLLPSLIQVGALWGEAPLERLELPSLAEVEGEIRLQGDTLQQVALPLLAHTGALILSDAGQLWDLQLHRLATVDGALALQALPSLSSLQPLDALVEVGGAVQLDGLGIVEPLLLRRLARVHGALILANNPGWIALDGLDALVQVDGALQIVDNPELVRLGGLPGPVEIEGGILIEGNEALSDTEIALFLARLSGG